MTEPKKDDAAKGDKAKETPHVESESERLDRLRQEDAAGQGRSEPS